MDKQIGKPKNISGRKVRTDSRVCNSPKIRSKEDRYVAKHHEGSTGVTKKEFIGLLTKAAKPIKNEAQSDSKNSET